ncbi:MAG TPA: hypothetical protein VK507_04940 [Iamia sp.]|nr:hypothetical protein [Iamia sp.]
MTHLSDTLRNAADGPVDLDLDAVHARVDRRRRHRARTRAACCVVGVVAVLGAAGVAAGVGGGAPDVQAGEAGIGFDDETTTTLAPPSTETTTSDSTTSTSTTTEPAPSTETTTSSTTLPPTTEAPPVTDPPPSLVHLEWTYAGLEQYRLFQPQCPDLTHWLDADATASDGTAWAMREDYCGHHDGTQWEGSGTFSLTTAGATLSGRMTSSAPMPTTGVPYSWTVEEGTGTLAGATGECVVTIFMTDAVFGSAHHEGSISCDITIGATGGDAGPGSEPEVPEAV